MQKLQVRRPRGAYVARVDMAAKLGREACARRERAGLTLLDVATEAGVSEATVSRFEQGHGWRRDTDRIVEAYARLLGTSSRAIWRAAAGRDS